MELKCPPVQIKNLKEFGLLDLTDYELSPIGYSNYGIIRIKGCANEYICKMMNEEAVLLIEVSILNAQKVVFQFSDVNLDVCMPWCNHHGIEWYLYDRDNSLYAVRVHNQVIEERIICSLDNLR